MDTFDGLRMGGKVFADPTRYEEEIARLESFCSDSWPLHTPVTIGDLAKAGFYYLGRGDRVRCYFCSGVLYGWEKGDTAVGEHRKHFPQCKFIQRNDATTATTSSESGVRLKTQDDNDKITLENWRGSNAVQIVRELDIYPLTVIECAVRKLLIDDGEDSFDSSTLLDVIFKIKNASTNDLHLAVEALTIEPRQQKSVEALEREVETLKSNKLCKICLDEVVAVVFLPCRHLVCLTIHNPELSLSVSSNSQ